MTQFIQNKLPYTVRDTSDAYGASSNAGAWHSFGGLQEAAFASQYALVGCAKGVSQRSADIPALGPTEARSFRK
jgi:hypothetical protein